MVLWLLLLPCTCRARSRRRLRRPKSCGCRGHFSLFLSDVYRRVSTTPNPAVYVIVSAFVEKKVITYTLYRVTFEEMALIVENGAEKSFSISIDEAAWPAARQLDQAARADLAERLQEGAIGQPFYNFLGLGFGTGALRQNWLTHLNLGANEYALSRSSIDSDAITHFAQGCITGELKAKITEAFQK